MTGWSWAEPIRAISRPNSKWWCGSTTSKVAADLTAIGGIAGCGDLLLSDFVGTTAEVRGIAWDPPIDPTAPQQASNDNFGSYNLGFQKNGGGGGGIIAATPNVPNVWPGPLAPGAAGTLANWDIVGALDGGPGPLPAGSPKLARGERCAYVITLHVQDTTYAINIINDITWDLEGRGASPGLLKGLRHRSGFVLMLLFLVSVSRNRSQRQRH